MSEYEGRKFNDGILYSGEYTLTSDFGPRVIGDVSKNHNGIDFVGAGNKNILSPVNGVVGTSTIITDENNLTWEWGNYVRIDSNDYLNIEGAQKYYFCHMSERKVTKGQIVQKGEIIGVEGDTGYSLGSHLHFEVRDNSGVSIDPKLLFWNDGGTNEPLPEDTIYNSISEVPEWARPYVQNWVEKGIVIGVGNSLNLTMSMIRILIMAERMGDMHNLIIESRTDDPSSPAIGQIWLRTDLA